MSPVKKPKEIVEEKDSLIDQVNAKFKFQPATNETEKKSASKSQIILSASE